MAFRFAVFLLRYFVFRHFVAVFYLCTNDLDGQNIFVQIETINQIMIVGML